MSSDTVFRLLGRVILLCGLVMVAESYELQAQEPPYVAPSDPLVREKLEAWQDRKFGLMMHWGLYAQLGIVESWALCSEDQPFQDRGGMPYTEFKEMYFGLIREFDPRLFDPAPWAEAARDAGMRYVVFTTKHHDGFSMWDTKQSDFRITGPDSPFRDNPKANVAKEVFDAFRAQGFMIGAYLSKPDWHHPDYWSPLWATPNRNNNYDTARYPEKWQSFRDFTYNQIEELVTTLGTVDILWLDGGWVRPDSTINDEARSWGFDIAPWEQDIDMPRIATMARSHQPGLLIVGPYGARVVRGLPHPGTKRPLHGPAVPVGNGHDHDAELGAQQRPGLQGPRAADPHPGRCRLQGRQLPAQRGADA